MPDENELSLSTLEACPEAARPQAGRPRHGLRQGPLLRPRDQGPEVAVGLAQDAARASRVARCRSTCGSASSAARPRRTRCRSARTARSTAGVNVSELERVFDDGAEVTIEALAEKRLIRNTRTDVKILGNGDLKKKLTVTAHLFSKSAAREDRGGRRHGERAQAAARGAPAQGGAEGQGSAETRGGRAGGG